MLDSFRVSIVVIFRFFQLREQCYPSLSIHLLSLNKIFIRYLRLTTTVFHFMTLLATHLDFCGEKFPGGVSCFFHSAVGASSSLSCWILSYDLNLYHKRAKISSPHWLTSTSWRKKRVQRKRNDKKIDRRNVAVVWCDDFDRCCPILGQLTDDIWQIYMTKMNSNDFIFIVNEDNEYPQLARDIITVMGRLLGIY
jgi:hypothetical protein